jgi:hypothetical protein
MFAPNRIAVYLLIITGVAGAVVPVLENFDTQSIIGWVAGIGAIAGAILKWLDGWQKFEDRQQFAADTFEQRDLHDEAVDV